MPSIKLNDQFGLDVDIQPGPAIAQYLKTLPHLLAEGVDLTKLGGLSLDDPAVTSLEAGLNFAQPVEIGRDLPRLTVQAGLSGSFSVISARDRNVLFASDDYGENVPMPEGACYVAVGLKASAGAQLGSGLGPLTFGARPGTAVGITCYRKFSAGPGAPTLIEALRDSIAGLVLPADAGGIESIPEDGLMAVDVKGSLQFSGSANLLAASNPLATLDLPSPLPEPYVKTGTSVSIGASYRIEGEYQVRIQKLVNGRFRLGWFRKRGTDFTVTATASAGLSAGFGDTDLFTRLITAISASAQADEQELSRAGLPPGEIASIEGAVEAAVSRRLELALSFELGACESGEAAFLYEVEPGALNDAGANALAQALAGDLSPLCVAEDALPAGVRLVRSIFSALQQARHTLKINLLGVYNFASLSKLALAGRVLYETATGNLVITDTATADRIRAAAMNFGADAAKLRQVFAESFLITAAYRGSRSVVSPPALRSSHVFFDLHDRTSLEQMRENLQVGIALALPLASTAGTPRGDDFGRTTVCAETQYDDALAAALFLDDAGQPRTLQEYENAGRRAILLLVREDAPDAYRRRPATDDALWKTMKRTGQPGLAALFPDLNELPVHVIAADYSTIVWWADAMRKTAVHLAGMLGWLQANPGATPRDEEFQKLRAKLAKHLKKVAASTREEFGRPWGLVAMDLVSGRRAEAFVEMTGKRLAFRSERPKAVAAG